MFCTGYLGILLKGTKKSEKSFFTFCCPTLAFIRVCRSLSRSHGVTEEHHHPELKKPTNKHIRKREPWVHPVSGQHEPNTPAVTFHLLPLSRSEIENGRDEGGRNVWGKSSSQMSSLSEKKCLYPGILCHLISIMSVSCHCDLSTEA